MKTQTLIIATLLLGSVSFGQQLPMGSHYFVNPFTINPAYTGQAEQTNIFMSHRSQFTGLAGSPQTTFVTIDGPLNVRPVGLGLKASFDVTNILSSTSIAGNYSYSVQFGGGHSLTFGLAAGIIDQTINYNQAIVRDVDDPTIFENKVHRAVFNADAGLLYQFKDLEVGFAVPQLLGNKARFRTDQGAMNYFNLERHYVASARYFFDVWKQQQLTVYPMVVVRAVSGAPVQFDASVVADWKQYGWLALNYRHGYAVSVSAGVRYKCLSIGYAHDFGITNVRSYIGSTHELLLSYSLCNDTRDRVKMLEDDMESMKVALANLESTESDVIPDIENLGENRASETQLENASELTSFKSDTVNLEEQDLLATQEGAPKHHSNQRIGDWRSHKSTDFEDENGMQLPAGYYVVIGSFSVKDNAKTFRSNADEKDPANVAIAFNRAISIYNVFVLYTTDYDEAQKERTKQSENYSNTWVLKLE